MNNKYFTVCGIVEIDNKILLVRHTYGTAKGRILIPGGYVQNDELPARAIEREIFEETGVTVQAKSIFATQFKFNEWCMVFTTEYIRGEPQPDYYENNEVILLDATEAIKRDDITNMSREILKAYIHNKKNTLIKSNYVPLSSNAKEYEIYGV
ncbi:MAG: NUDIX hydrolase [Eubacterium sp.]|nr:NUDIX hydrolase [Eubacterium sp.]